MAFINNNFASIITNPFPMLVRLASTQSNATGSGTAIPIHFDTAVYDPYSCYDVAHYGYLPKVDGAYKVHICVLVSGLTASHYDGRLQVTSGANMWEGYYASPYSQSTGVGHLVTIEGDMLVTATAGSLILPRIKISGGTATLDFEAGTATEPTTYFQVYRVA
jgi:hypothetical protein